MSSNDNLLEELLEYSSSDGNNGAYSSPASIPTDRQ